MSPISHDVHERLYSLWKELGGLDPCLWSNIEAWSAKASPIIRSDWPDQFDAFSKEIAASRSTIEAGEGVDASKQTAQQAKERILSFLDELLTVS
jgi:hypothetical protein